MDYIFGKITDYHISYLLKVVTLFLYVPSFIFSACELVQHKSFTVWYDIEYIKVKTTLYSADMEVYNISIFA